MNRLQFKNSLLLLLTATIWGVAFVAQSVGMEYVGPFTFNGVRSLIGAVFLIPCILFLSRLAPSDTPVSKSRSAHFDKTLLAGGISCGLVLTAASMFQQYGVMYTSVGKAGFLTAVYIVLVPILGLFLKKKCSPFVWLSVILALIGLYLLSITDGFTSIETGDILLLIGAFLFAVHILVIDHFSPLCDGVKMSCIQFFVCGVICTAVALILESPSLTAILSAAAPILYAGILSCGVAYTLQIIGQKNMNPTVASLILSLESAISVLAGWLLLQQKLTPREITGCIIVFAAIIIAQLPSKNNH